MAVKAAVAGRYQNTGQVCAAAKRFIVEEGIAQAFTDRFVAAAAALKMGDPLVEENDLGPMARFDLRDELHQQVQASVAEGARLLLGGEKIAGEGNYYAATVAFQLFGLSLRLDPAGNSLAGIAALEQLTQTLGRSVY